MNQQNRNINFPFSRDLTAGNYGNGNRMERASNWSVLNSSAGSYNSNGGGANYNTNAFTSNNGGNFPRNVGYNSNNTVGSYAAGNFPNNGGNYTNALVQLLSLMSTNAGNAGQFPVNNFNRPQISAALMNRGRSGPNNGNWSSKSPLKRPQGSKPEALPQKAKEQRRGPAKTTAASPSATQQKPVAAAKPANAAKPTNAAKPNKPANPAKAANPAKPTNAAQPSKDAKPAGNKTAKGEPKSAPTGPIHVAVLPNNYPRDTLQPEDLALLEEAIIDEVAIGHDKKIHFTGVEHRTNMLVIECKDWDSYGWLRTTIPKLSGWKGVSLMAIMPNRIPKTYTVSMFLPRSSGKTHEQVLALIKAQNEGLRIDRWSIKSSTEENDGLSLVITIDGFSHKVIGENNNTISYRYGTVPVVKLEEAKTEPVDEEQEGAAVDVAGNEIENDEEMPELAENGDATKSAD